MGNFWLGLGKTINKLLFLLGLRKSQLHWGVVYDSATKQPIDPAIVKLIDADTGKAIQTSFTDLTGRYGFLARPGTFKILARKTNYMFPSVANLGDKDGIYDKLYHGEFFKVSGDNDVIALNIPMDPENFDWNQEAKLSVANAHPNWEHLKYSLVRILFWFVFILSGLWYYETKQAVWLNVLIFYGIIFFLNIVTPHFRLWGRVKNSQTGLPLQNVTVEICHSELPDMAVAKSETTEEGKFFARIPPGNYILNFVQIGEKLKKTVLGTKKVKVGSEGIINQEISI